MSSNRQDKVFININNADRFNSLGEPLGNKTFPQITSGEQVDYACQFVEEFTSPTEFEPVTQFVGQTITASAVIDDDFTHYIDGVLVDATLSGAITSIEISGLSEAPIELGFILLTSDSLESESVEYTAVTKSGSNYIFTVSATLTYSYVAGNEANMSDPALIKSTTVDQTDKDTGLFIVTMNAQTLPYLRAVRNIKEIASCQFEFIVRNDSSQPTFIQSFDIKCYNTRDNDGVIPPPANGDYYTKLEVDSLLNSYMPRSQSTVDVGALLNADDYFPVYNKDTGLAERYKISDISLGAGIPPVQNEYADIATMLADQGSQTQDYIQQAGTDFYKKKATSTADISDYDQIGGGGTAPIENIYADTTAMIADQGSQTVDYIEKAGTSYYHYLGTTVGDITDYQQIGGDAVATDDCGVDTGVLYGLDVSINVDTSKVDISSGAIFIRDYMTDPENPVYKKCIYDGETAVSLTYLASATYTQFVAVEDLPSNAGKVRIEQLGGTEEDVPYYKDKVKIQGAIHFDNVSIFSITTTKQLAFNKINDLIEYSVANGAIVKGVTIIDNGVADLSCTQTAGTAVAVDINSVNDTRYSSDKSFTEIQASFVYNYRSSPTEFSYETNATSVLKPSLYNNLSTNTVDAVPAGKFTIQRNFFFPISNTRGLAYGQKLYDSQEEAIADLQNGFIEAPTFEDGVLVTAIICKSGATSTKNQADILFAQAKRESFDTGLTNIAIRPGFLDIDKSEFSYDNGTRTLTLSPIAPETTIKVRLFNGTIIEQASFAWTNTNVEGLHYFYLDDEGLEQSSAGPNREAINNFLRSTISIGFISWADASFDKANIVTDFRKSATGMSPDTTAKNFFDVEIYPLDGVPVTDFPVAPDGSVATDAQFGFATDELLIGDRQFDFPAFSRGDTWRVLYMDGSNVRHLDKPLYAFATGDDFGLAEDKPTYNNGGTPAFVDPPNANSPRYVYYIMGVTNEIDPAKRMITWMGDLEYDSQVDAEAGLANEIARVESLSGIKQEFRATYAVLYEIDLDYTNAHNVIALDIVKITTETSVGGTSSTPSGLVDGSNADNYHKHEAQALQASTSAVNDDNNTVYRANGAGVIKKSYLSISDATTNAVVDTDALVSGDVTNTFAGSTDGTVTVLDAPADNITYRLYVSGTAQVRIENVTGDAIWPTITNVDGVFEFKFNSISGEYK